MHCRSGGGGGSGKPQFVSANPFRGPSSIKRPTQVCSQHTTPPTFCTKQLPSSQQPSCPQGRCWSAHHMLLFIAKLLGSLCGIRWPCTQTIHYCFCYTVKGVAEPRVINAEQDCLLATAGSGSGCHRSCTGSIQSRSCRGLTLSGTSQGYI